jgi:hypothetical protein
MLDNPDECNIQLISLDTNITLQSVVCEEAFDEPDDSLKSFSNALIKRGPSAKTDTVDDAEECDLQLVPLVTDTKCDLTEESKKNQYSFLCSIIVFAALTLGLLT